MGIACDFSGYATRNDLLCGDGQTEDEGQNGGEEDE